MTARPTSHRATWRDIPRGWTMLLLILASWAALIGAGLFVHAVVMRGGLS